MTGRNSLLIAACAGVVLVIIFILLHVEPVR